MLVGHGLQRPVPAPLGDACYRLVQEALSNARKHAPGRPVTIDVDCGVEAGAAAALTVTVVNPLPVLPARPAGVGVLAASGGGHGLAGLAERFALLGGTCLAGPAGQGRGRVFRVAACVPLPPSALLRQAGRERRP